MASVRNGTRRLSSVTTFLISSGYCLGKIHRDVAAHRMPDHGQLVIVGVGLDLLHLLDGEMNVGDAALDLRQAADIELADLGHHRRIGRQVMLRGEHQIAARREDGREERILGVLDRVAVVDHRHRQLDHAGIGLHLLVPANGDVDRNQTAIARRIVEGDRLMPDRPLVRGEIAHHEQRAQRKQNGNSTFHLVLGATCAGPLRRPVFRSRLCGPLLIIYVTLT